MYSLFLSSTTQIDELQNAFIELTNDIRHLGIETMGRAKFLSKKNHFGLRKNDLVIELDKSIVSKEEKGWLALKLQKRMIWNSSLEYSTDGRQIWIIHISLDKMLRDRVTKKLT